MLLTYICSIVFGLWMSKKKKERKKEKSKIEVFPFDFLECALHYFPVFILELVPYLKYRTSF